jgi:RHS repeat-associated protein
LISTFFVSFPAAGRLAALSDPATGTTAAYSYNSLSQVTGISYGTGADSRSFGYDSLHRLTSDTLTSPSGATVASVSYGYDADGQITSLDTAGLAGASSNGYAYDRAGRLASWDNGTTTTGYGYDGAGNLTRDGSKTFTYDARGELTGDGTDTYTYTARGTPSSESSPAGTVQVTFDAYGDQATAGTRSYAYDALGRLTAGAGAAGTGYAFSYAGATGAIASDGTSAYTWDPSGSVLAGIGTPGGGPAGVLAFTDSHGDVLGQFTAAGTAMAGSRAYDPWGGVTAAAGTMAGGLGFQGAWADPGTGKDLMGARWYDPQAGDFTSADTVQVSPVPDPAAAAPYAYAGDDPLDAADPTGHCTWLGTEAGVAAACMPQAASGTASGQATISPRAYGSGQGRNAGWGLNTGSFAGGQQPAKDETGSGIMGALSQLMYQAWLRQQYQQQRSSRSQPHTVADAPGPGGHAYDTPSGYVVHPRSRPPGAGQPAGGGSRGSPVPAARKPAPSWKPHPAPQPAGPVLAPAPDESSVLASAAAAAIAAIAALASTSALDSTSGPAGQVIQRLSGDLAGFIQDYGPQILGTLAGLGVLAACETLTAGAATPACSALAGAASGGISYTLSAARDGTFTGHGLLGAALGGAAGWAAAGTLGDTTTAPEDAADTGGGLTRVGRWMSPEEHEAMTNTGMVQEGGGGTTYVAHPADPAAYGQQAAAGSRYVEFDVPQDSLAPAGKEGWAQIPGPNSLYGRLAAMRGEPIPQFPPALNIEWLLTK